MSHCQPLHLLLFLLLIAYIWQSPQVPPSKVDGFLLEVALSKLDTNRVNGLLRLGQHQLCRPGEYKADLDSARTYAGQAQDLSQKPSDYRMEAKSFNLLGFIYLEFKNF